MASIDLLVKCDNGDLITVPVSAQVLAASSPVFARIIEGGWKESSEGKIVVEGFGADQVREFVECLQEGEDKYKFTKGKIRAILPLVHYYQTTCVIKRIVGYVRQLEMFYPDVPTGTSCEAVFQERIEAFVIAELVEEVMVNEGIDLNWPRFIYRMFLHIMTEKASAVPGRLIGNASMGYLNKISPACLRKILYYLEIAKNKDSAYVVADFCGFSKSRLL